MTSEKMIMNDPMYERALTLLVLIWRAIDSDYKSQYRREIWRMFADAVRVSANQNATLERFASALCMRVRASLGRNEKDRGVALQLFNLPWADRMEMLRVYRLETAFVVLLVQEAMKGIREEAEGEY